MTTLYMPLPKRTGGTLPVAAWLQPRPSESGRDDVALSCTRVEQAGHPDRRLYAGRYLTKLISVSAADVLPIAGEA